MICVSRSVVVCSLMIALALSAVPLGATILVIILAMVTVIDHASQWVRRRLE